jgi:hypothetical protein
VPHFGQRISSYALAHQLARPAIQRDRRSGGKWSADWGDAAEGLACCSEKPGKPCGAPALIAAALGMWRLRQQARPFAPEAHIRSKIWKTGSALFRLQTPTLCALEDVHNE